MPVPAEPSGFDTMMSELGMPAETNVHALRPQNAARVGRAGQQASNAAAQNRL
jgi:hypothetical protein